MWGFYNLTSTYASPWNLSFQKPARITVVVLRQGKYYALPTSHTHKKNNKNMFICSHLHMSLLKGSFIRTQRSNPTFLPKKKIKMGPPHTPHPARIHWQVWDTESIARERHLLRSPQFTWKPKRLVRESLKCASRKIGWFIKKIKLYTSWKKHYTVCIQ